MNRFETAKYIQLGASDPRTISAKLELAILRAHIEGGLENCKNDPAIRLMLHRLLFVLYGIDLYSFDTEQLNTKQWHKDNRTCDEFAKLQNTPKPR